MLATQLCLTLQPRGLSSPAGLWRSSVHGILQASMLKQIHSLLQALFLTQGSNPNLHTAGRLSTV